MDERYSVSAKDDDEDIDGIPRQKHPPFISGSTRLAFRSPSIFLSISLTSFDLTSFSPVIPPLPYDVGLSFTPEVYSSRQNAPWIATKTVEKEVDAVQDGQMATMNQKSTTLFCGAPCFLSYYFGDLS